MTQKPTVNIDKCRRSFRQLTVFFLCWFIPAAIIAGATFLDKEQALDGNLGTLLTAVYVIATIASLVQLGRLASMNQRSWVLWSLLPVFCAVMGPLLAYVLMWRVGRNNGWA